MAVSPLQLDFGLTCRTLPTDLISIPPVSSMRELVADIGKFESSTFLRVEVPGEGMPLQESSWQDFFGDPTQWWDSRRRKFGHNISKVPLWLNSGYKPAWVVDLQLAASDARRKAISLEVLDSLGADDCPLEIGMCRKLCENGRISDAVDALNLRVQQGCQVHTNLFYVVLKRCIANNDLVMGTRIHSLTIKSGHEGDAFLATHLMSLYASHGSLEEAMQVFTKVTVPTVYNWTTIIFAHARRGEATQAIRLYQRMLESATIKPDNRMYVAVLKACATARDLVAGKEVHTHILANPGKPDIFVQAGLVNMYAKCGSLGDARRTFDRLPERNVVTWTALIAGYTQHGMGQEALSLYSRMQEEGLTLPNSVTYVCLLQACASIGVAALDQGKQLHKEIEERGLEENLVLGGSLVNMYAKCSSLGDARRVFDRLPDRDVVTWTALIAGYTQHGLGHEALSLYISMQREGLNPPDSIAYVCLLQACATVGVEALQQGKQLHAQIKEKRLQEDLVLGGTLVNMYAKCGSLGDARRVFDRLAERDVVTWTALIAGYAQHGMGQEALSLYSSMRQEGLTAPNSVTYVCLLQACANIGAGAVDQGQQLHAQIEEQGLQGDLVLCGSLVNMYAKCGSLKDARRVFDRLPERGVFTWTVLITGYAQHGMDQEALSLYSSMRNEGLRANNSVTYLCLLQACASIGVGALDQGKELHAEIEEMGLEKDLILGGSLVHMYAKCGSLEDARRVFDRLLERDVVTWTALIAGYTQQGIGHEALSLYSSMQNEGLNAPDCVTYVCLLQACAGVGLGALEQGKQLHADIEEQGLQEDLVLGGSLVNMYAKCGSLVDARRVFDKLAEKDVVTWTALIAGYAQQGMGQEALSVYSSMQNEGLSAPNSVTYVCLLQACASVGVGAVDEGKQLHAQIEEEGLQDNLVLGGSLVNMYAKCGSLADARRVFDKLSERDVVTWTALISGYAQQGMDQEALTLYSSMQNQGLTAPNSVTYACLLQACGSVAALPLGKQLHAEIEEQGFQIHVTVGAGLVSMYAKCGSMFDSQKVFNSLPERSIEAWNALTSGYARQGDAEVVFDLVDKMRLEGIQPDDVTCLCLLTVCSHIGDVDKGRKYFEAMKLDYGIDPTIEHYTCMVDLLGRAGLLDEALQMAKTMPFLPDVTVWHALLGACRKWNNVEIAQHAFEFAVTQDGRNAASYVLMSNIYARAQMWEEAKEMQARRVKSEAWKKPGQSWWTDMDGVVHTFVVGDKKHPESEGIYARLEQLVPKMKKAGYSPHLDSSLRDISDDEKEAELCGHSEKLAIAYALNKTPEGTTIRIVKNLRVCEDCHSATAYISKIEKRTIICRDVSRFHVYEEGKCSCGDYW